MSRERIRRFTVVQRWFHVLLVTSFMIQSATGLARMFIETGWGKGLASIFGGYEGALIIHKVGGTFMVLLFIAHLAYLAIDINWKRFPASIFGPDTLMPQLSDFSDFLKHIGWFLGLAEEPKFRRWAYWEKFGYWAVFWGVAMFGVTGFMLFDPVVSGRYVPGWSLNLALYLHREEAELAMGYLFIVHFFVSHFRPRRFPMDRVIFDGSLELAEIREERPAWLRQLEQNGALESMMVTSEPSRSYRVITTVFGYCVVALGIGLLIMGVMHLRYVGS